MSKICKVTFTDFQNPSEKVLTFPAEVVWTSRPGALQINLPDQRVIYIPWWRISSVIVEPAVPASKPVPDAYDVKRETRVVPDKVSDDKPENEFLYENELDR